MNEPAFSIEQPRPDTLAVSGSLTFPTAANVLERASAVLAKGGVRVLDLSGVRAADSAGLACVLALMARADRYGSRPEIRHLPANLHRLAAVSDSETLLAGS